MLRSFAIQAVIFFIAFQLLSFVRESSMLATDTHVTPLVTANNQDYFSVPTLRSDEITLKSQDKKTVLYFFAPWCQVCHVSIGNLQSLFQHNDNIDVIAVALDFTSKKELITFTNRHQLTFPIALGNENIKSTFEISGYPSYYVLDENSVIIAKSMGYSSELGLYLRTL